MKKEKVEKIITIVDEKFDMEKNYKLFRLTQKLLNPTWHLKDKYQDETIFVANNKLTLRIFNPFKDNKNHKLAIFIHGGGWVSGSLSSYTPICVTMASKLKRIIIAIDYRLAPEHPFPIGFIDCYEAVKLIYHSANQVGINAKDIVLIGDSAGGNLTAAVSQKSHDTKEFKVYTQILLYPSTQNDYSKTTKYKSVIEYGTNQLLSQKKLESFINLYLPIKEQRTNKYASPLIAKNLFGLPKTLIIVGNKDPLRDESLAYARKLRRHLVWCHYYVLDQAEHGFMTNILDKKYKNLAVEKMIKFLGDKNE